MSDAVGWHQNPDDPTVSKYWDGQRWQGELRWNGTDWTQVSGPAAPAVPAPPIANAPSAPGAAAGALANMTRIGWALAVAAGCSVLGIFLPLASATNVYLGTRSVSFSDDGGVVVMLAGLAALVVWMGWPARLGRHLSWVRIVVLVLVALFWTLAVVSNWNDLADGQDELAGTGSSVHAGLGLYLYAGAMISIWAGIVLAAKDRIQPGGNG